MRLPQPKNQIVSSSPKFIKYLSIFVLIFIWSLCLIVLFSDGSWLLYFGMIVFNLFISAMAYFVVLSQADLVTATGEVLDIKRGGKRDSTNIHNVASVKITKDIAGNMQYVVLELESPITFGKLIRFSPSYDSRESWPNAYITNRLLYLANKPSV